ncbi:hypothetical protein Nepgr_005618 [Nepenthes gracilis]|uniref:Uncharacterized protein n=1 Tax=Nepenthes gracilis TaxID=150966 RepID=A0AAD3XGJ0_NEPGR|nr:hypothetical protein Nepgr_005618 [Nepenthes gracilis]
MGQNFNHNAVVYSPEPHYKCGSLQLYYIDFPIQGRAVQNGSRKVMDNTWVQMYDDKDVDVDDSTATTSNSGSGATGPPKTLQLFPTTATGCGQEEQPTS